MITTAVSPEIIEDGSGTAPPAMTITLEIVTVESLSWSALLINLNKISTL